MILMELRRACRKCHRKLGDSQMTNAVPENPQVEEDYLFSVGGAHPEDAAGEVEEGVNGWCGRLLGRCGRQLGSRGYVQGVCDELVGGIGTAIAYLACRRATALGG